jgi:hypothetical protein
MSNTSKSWKTWSPFQSPEVREIYAHMTDDEMVIAMRHAGAYGIWVALTFAVPLAQALTHPNPVVIVIAAILVTVHIVCIPVWRKMQKRFLSSTAWAREQGITPEQIRMFAFRRR